MTSPLTSRLAPPLALALLLPLACADEPPGLTRVAAWFPQGDAVPTSAAATIDLSAPVSPEGILDARRVALAVGPLAKAAAAAVGSEEGLAAGAPVIPCEISLSPDGRRITLQPRAPLAAGVAHALLLGPVRDLHGHPVLDPDGRRRTFSASFKTAPPAGPPPAPALTEALAAAAMPQAGGEYVELQNRGAGPLDLTAWRLEKRSASGAWSGCDLLPTAGGAVGPGGFALLTGDAWDGRYGTPAALPRATCGAAALAGGLADDRPLELRLLDPEGAVRATLGAGGGTPRCAGALALVDPAGGDSAANLACLEGIGTPGACNEVTPPARCD